MYGCGGRSLIRVLSLIESELLEEVVQSDPRDANAKGLIDEVDQIGPGRCGVGENVPGDRSGVTWQEFAIGAAIHSVMSLLDRLLGRQVLLPRGRLTAEVGQTSDLGDLESALAMQKEMVEQPIGVVVSPFLLAEAVSVLEQAALLGRQS